MRVQALTSLMQALLLAGCVTAGSREAPDPAARLSAECALLAEAAQQMGPEAHPGLTEGCPGSETRDIRPHDVQFASLREAASAPLPAGIAVRSRAETVFRRMIMRGVPVALAVSLTRDPRFVIAAGQG